ncbi:MAG TPA: aminoglycoside phosphotransferase family protein [Anaerolineae bacterium]|nr:aminoglycoside phosphotransferase family protein [Anaerolineae bacterium]
MMQQLVNLVDQQWDVWAPRTPRPRETSFLLQSRNRVIVFVFARGARLPTFVAKIGRNHPDAPRLRQEYDNLLYLRDRLGDLASTLPRPLYLGEVAGHPVMVETFLTGKVMLPTGPLCWRRNYSRDLQAMLVWLKAFQTRTTVGYLRWDEAVLDAKARRRIDKAGRKAGVSRITVDYLNNLANGLRDRQLPLVSAHGDLHHSNILLADGRVCGVTDWEFSSRASYPFFDWFQFLFEYNLELSKKRRRGLSREKLVVKAISGIFSPTSSLANLARPRTEGLFATYGLSDQLAPLFFTLYLLDFHWPGDRNWLLRSAFPLVAHPQNVYAGRTSK